MITEELRPAPESVSDAEAYGGDIPEFVAETELDIDDPEYTEAAPDFEPVITSSIENQFRLENGEWVTDLVTAEGDELKGIKLLEHDPELLEKVLNLGAEESISTSKEGANMDGQAAVFTTAYVRDGDHIVVTHMESLAPAEEEIEEAAEEGGDIYDFAPMSTTETPVTISPAPDAPSGGGLLDEVTLEKTEATTPLSPILAPAEPTPFTAPPATPESDSGGFDRNTHSPTFELPTENQQEPVGETTTQAAPVKSPAPTVESKPPLAKPEFIPSEIPAFDADSGGYEIADTVSDTYMEPFITEPVVPVAAIEQVVPVAVAVPVKESKPPVAIIEQAENTVITAENDSGVYEPADVISEPAPLIVVTAPAIGELTVSDEEPVAEEDTGEVTVIEQEVPVAVAVPAMESKPVEIMATDREEVVVVEQEAVLVIEPPIESPVLSEDKADVEAVEEIVETIEHADVQEIIPISVITQKGNNSIDTTPVRNESAPESEAAVTENTPHLVMDQKGSIPLEPTPIKILQPETVSEVAIIDEEPVVQEIVQTIDEAPIVVTENTGHLTGSQTTGISPEETPGRAEVAEQVGEEEPEIPFLKEEYIEETPAEELPVPVVHRVETPAVVADWREEFAVEAAETDDDWRMNLTAPKPAAAKRAEAFTRAAYVPATAQDDDDDIVISITAAPSAKSKRPVRRASKAAA